MKTLWNFILLVGLLCLAGCSKEEPQSVIFSMHEHKVPNYGEICSVTIKANCPWTISENSREILIEEMKGTGDEYVRINIAENLGHEDLTHRIVVTSEDGTSSDELLILQDSQKDILVDKDEIATANGGIIAAEGGTVLVPIKTNDEIISIDTPDWMSVTSGRAFTNYTYTFVAEPNKTGSERVGTITFKGHAVTKNVEIIQDSYAPTGITFAKDIEIINDRWIKTNIQLMPEYSDWTKLNVSSSEGCVASLKNGVLHVEMEKYGEYQIDFSTEEGILLSKTVWSIPKNPILTAPVQSLIIGEELSVELRVKHPDMTISSSDPSVVAVTNDFTIKAVGKGEATVTIEIPGTNIRGEIQVTSDMASVTAQIAEMTNKASYVYFRLTAMLTTNQEFTIKSYKITGYNGKDVMTNGGYICHPEKNTTCILTDILAFQTNLFSTVLVQDYKFHIKIEMDGSEQEFEQTINHHTIGTLNHTGAMWINFPRSIEY